jgi:glucose-6-phosphate isomerase
LFKDETRFARFSLQADGLLFDYSKTLLDDTRRAALLGLVQAAGLEQRRDALFAGARVNETESRAALHMAWRAGAEGQFAIDGQDVMAQLRATDARLMAFAKAVRAGHVQGAGGAICDVVNIGIGGSDLGPAMAVAALAPYGDGPRCHFVSNVDGAHLHDCLAGLDPRRTLVIVASKTFDTLETMTNAASARAWMQAGGGDLAAQFVAISSATQRALDFGLRAEQVFGFADWVGGRYSVWGPIGLAVILAIGPENFAQFRAGAAAMDRHFCTSPLAENMPVLFAMVGLWHRQVLGYATRAIVPYDQRLALLPAYLQQLEMESNGKSVTRAGQPVAQPTGAVVWGAAGTGGQHAFFQLLHQGTDIVPCEFMVAAQGHEADLAHHHRLLVANCLAQAEALMRGRATSDVLAMLAAHGVHGAEAQALAAHRSFAGNRPSVTLAYDRLSPYRLGQILALYEHRVFVEAVVLGINPFDQWGVELGKELAQALVPMVEGREESDGKDGSTRGLLRFLQGRAE